MMMIYTSNESFTLYHGDNREVLKQLPDNSIDSVVTDPPYELGFMGKKWDSTGIAYDVQLWREVLRVLKPGGHLLAFSGSRTYHRMAVAIEDAGFEVRDQIMWIYGSGFPKSLDIQKSIEKSDKYGFGSIKKTWQGWGTALKPAHEPIVMARKPLIGTVANNVLTWGVGGLNIDASRVGDTVETWPKSRSYPFGEDRTYGSKDAETELTQSAPNGRWPANIIHDGSDEVVELFPDAGNKWKKNYGAEDYVGNQYKGGIFGGGGYNGQNTYADSGSAARFFYCAKANKRDRNEGLDGFEMQQFTGGGGLTAELREDGSYETASAGGKYGSIKAKQQNHHPTVKPTDLMAYLCRLVTPKGGTVLDPFMGSGSTGKAAMYEGFKFIGIEMTDEYLPIAKARIEFALNEESEKLPNADVSI
jgi:DNA modification methylase